MQSHDWRLFNVLVDMASPEQLKYVCSNGEMLIMNIITIMKLALSKSHQGAEAIRKKMSVHPMLREKEDRSEMTQVRKFIMSTLAPKCVNKSLSFVTPSLSFEFLKLFKKAQIIEAHLKDYSSVKIQHNNVI